MGENNCKQDIVNATYSILNDIDLVCHIKEVKDLITANIFLCNSYLSDPASKKRIVQIYIESMSLYLADLEKRLENDSES